MAKKDRAYKIGDLVFAKVKGYPPWPAKIVRLVAKNKYNVYFYGTGETGFIKMEDLNPYVESKEKLATDKNMKRAHFKEAIDQIEAALRGEDSAPIEIAGGEPPESADDTAPTDSSMMETTADETLEKVEEAPVVKTPVSKVKSDGKQTKKTTSPVKHEATPPPEEPVVSPTGKDNGAEVTSRSGRKIKPKKYLLEEVEEASPPAPKRKAGAVDGVNSDTKPAKVAKVEMNNVKEEVKIHLKHQGKLIDLTTKIKATLGLQRANPQACVKLLEEYNDLEITPIMLLKNPGCVETVKRLRKYVGNVKKWVMSDQEKEDFEQNAYEVRKRAQTIYTQFKKMFINDDGIPFWEFFTRQLDKFNTATKDFSSEELVQMTELPDDQKHLSAIGNDKSAKENQTPNDHPVAAVTTTDADQDDTNSAEA
ncbi:uncharacterized protein DMENIID0001_116290 [Sergentomyia squamirostris]